jgi:hypothetical protein
MFQLDNAYRPKRQKAKGENNPNTRQAVLFAGMELLPGQMDLFPTDGTAPAAAGALPELPASPTEAR